MEECSTLMEKPHTPMITITQCIPITLFLTKFAKENVVRPIEILIEATPVVLFQTGSHVVRKLLDAGRLVEGPREEDDRHFVIASLFLLGR